VYPSKNLRHKKDDKCEWCRADGPPTHLALDLEATFATWTPILDEILAVIDSSKRAEVRAFLQEGPFHSNSVADLKNLMERAFPETKALASDGDAVIVDCGHGRSIKLTLRRPGGGSPSVVDVANLADDATTWGPTQLRLALAPAGGQLAVVVRQGQGQGEAPAAVPPSAAASQRDFLGVAAFSQFVAPATTAANSQLLAGDLADDDPEPLGESSSASLTSSMRDAFFGLLYPGGTSSSRSQGRGAVVRRHAPPREREGEPPTGRIT